jgi:hypothetical protein
MTLVRTLIDRAQSHSEPALPPGLSEMYDGDLHFPESSAERPFVLANFVSTLDGVVSYVPEIASCSPDFRRQRGTDCVFLE